MGHKMDRLTRSMTIFLRDCLCFFGRFWKMSQLSSCSSLKPTARWWFSRTDSSLYMRASSESENGEAEGKQWAHFRGGYCRAINPRWGDGHIKRRGQREGALTHLCWWGTDWTLLDGPHRGWQQQRWRRGSQGLWRRPVWNKTKREGAFRNTHRSKLIPVCGSPSGPIGIPLA